MIFEFHGPATLARNPDQKSHIVLEAQDEREAKWKLNKYIRIGKFLKWYSNENNNRT